MERLDKVVSESGALSRKECREAVKKGRITIDGVKAVRFDQKVDKSKMTICLDGKPLLVKRRVVAMLHKPSGVVTSTDDPRDVTVMSLVPSFYQAMGLFPVGRLDKETEGLLLMTNDGELAHRLIAPKHGIRKVYYVEHEGILNQEDVEAFDAGITLRDGTICHGSTLHILNDHHCLLVLTEGKYHQVRRMLASRGCFVTYLRRIQEGDLKLGTLQKGHFRELSLDEEKMLFSAELPIENA